MPTLNWIGKDAVVNHHKEVPFRLLKCNDKLSVGDDSGNMLVYGRGFSCMLYLPKSRIRIDTVPLQS